MRSGAASPPHLKVQYLREQDRHSCAKITLEHSATSSSDCAAGSQEIATVMVASWPGARAFHRPGGCLRRCTRRNAGALAGRKAASHTRGFGQETQPAVCAAHSKGARTADYLLSRGSKACQAASRPAPEDVGRPRWLYMESVGACPGAQSQLVVEMVEEPLQLGPGERPAPRCDGVVGRVPGRVPLEQLFRPRAGVRQPRRPHIGDVGLRAALSGNDARLRLPGRIGITDA